MVATLTQPRPRAYRKRSEEDLYPDSDGKPVGETIYHRDNIFYATSTLNYHFRNRPDAYVSGNDFIYFVEGDPTKRVSPDTYVIKGLANNAPRLTYLLWKEGIAPCFVIEFTSVKTRKQDQGFKRELYRAWGVREYIRFDPTLQCLKPALQGERLVNGVYLPIEQIESGRLYSEELELDLVQVGRMLQFQNPFTREPLRTYEEAEVRGEREHQRAERERLRAEEERQEKEAERQRAEAERQRAEVAEQQVERERREKEAERQRAELAEQRTAQLLAELERLQQALNEKA